ncbi:MAG: Vms1/Ankzf1 family peptidyl-tRNA hydrolase [Nitrospiraceae bacterium]|nr:Vms1/Ankzf1 family peptidyl-tRNA hydrolase [Nitrospiraceae bacterium]
MLNLEELRELARINPEGDYYASLYLNVDPVTNPGGEYLIRVKNMLRETAEGLQKTKTVLKKVKTELERFENYFLTQKPAFKKAVCLISGREGGLWREYHLAVPVQSGLFVDGTPYLKPLLDAVDSYPRYLALLVSKDEARIFVVQMGEILEYGEVKSPDVMGSHGKGGWFALEQDRFARHVEFHVQLHLADVIRRLEGFIQEQEVRKIVIGGPQEAVSMCMEMLPGSISGMVIGTFAAGMYEPAPRVLEKALPALALFERKEKEKLIEALVERAHKNDRAVMGLEDVLLMVQEKRIMTLVLDPALKQTGFVCGNCRALSISPGDCRFCGSGVDRVNYLIDLVMQKTVEYGGRVEVAPGNEKLQTAGKIGAILRF